MSAIPRSTLLTRSRAAQFQRLLASVVAKAVASMELQQQRGPAAAAAVATATAAAKLDPSSEPPGQLQQQPSAALLAGGPAGAAGGAGAGPSAGAAGMSGMEPRLLSTHHFLELVGKLGGFKKVSGRTAQLAWYGWGVRGSMPGRAGRPVGVGTGLRRV